MIDAQNSNPETNTRERAVGRALDISFAAYITLFASSQALFFATRFVERAGGVTDWIASYRLAIEFSNELVCFALVALVIFLCFAFPRAMRGGAILRPIVLSILAMTVPVTAAMLIAQGRMVYEIGGLPLGEDINALLASAYFGCQHILFLCFAAVAVIAAFDRKFPRWARIVSPLAGLVLGAGAYSWLFPSEAGFLFVGVFLAYGAIAAFAVHQTRSLQ